jgi:hypothetical protein
MLPARKSEIHVPQSLSTTNLPDSNREQIIGFRGLFEEPLNLDTIENVDDLAQELIRRWWQLNQDLSNSFFTLSEPGNWLTQHEIYEHILLGFGHNFFLDSDTFPGDLELMIDFDLLTPLESLLNRLDQPLRAGGINANFKRTIKRLGSTLSMHSYQDTLAFFRNEEVNMKQTNQQQLTTLNKFKSILSRETRDRITQHLSDIAQLLAHKSHLTLEQQYSLYLNHIQIPDTEEQLQQIRFKVQMGKKIARLQTSIEGAGTSLSPVAITPFDILIPSSGKDTCNLIIKDLNQLILFAIERETHLSHFSVNVLSAMLKGQSNISRIKAYRTDGLEAINGMTLDPIKQELAKNYHGIQRGNIIPLLDKQRDRRIKVKNFMQKVFQSPYFQDQFEKFCTDNKIENYQELLPQ